jgi:hypothetical protein
MIFQARAVSKVRDYKVLNYNEAGFRAVIVLSDNHV